MAAAAQLSSIFPAKSRGGARHAVINSRPVALPTTAAEYTAVGGRGKDCLSILLGPVTVLRVAQRLGPKQLRKHLKAFVPRLVVCVPLPEPSSLPEAFLDVNLSDPRILDKHRGLSGVVSHHRVEE